MRDEKEGRKKEASKVKQTTRQSNTAYPRQSLFLRKVSSLRWGYIYMYMYMLCPIQLYCVYTYIYMYRGKSIASFPGSPRHQLIIIT